MNKEKVILVLAVLIGTSQGYAGREDFNRPSEELRSAIATAATSLGYDLSTDDGRKQFGDYLKAARDKSATAAGADMNTDEGRKAYMQTVKAHREEVAKAQNFDMTTQTGRESLEKYLVSNGEYASMMPPGRGGRERPSQSNGSNSESGPDAPSDSNAAASNVSSSRSPGQRRR